MGLSTRSHVSEKSSHILYKQHYPDFLGVNSPLSPIGSITSSVSLLGKIQETIMNYITEVQG